MPESKREDAAASAGKQDLLAAVDRRTGREYQLPIEDDTITAMDLRKIRVREEDFGMLSFDPALLNTVICRSAITDIDGEKGILNYRGYPIEQLAEHSNYLEVAWLILHGELPARAELEQFRAELAAELKLPESTTRLHEAMAPDLHPMSMMEAALAALGGDYPDADDVSDPASRRRQIMRLLALTPVLAGVGHRRRAGLPPVEPRPDLDYAGNLLHMMLAPEGGDGEVPGAYVRAMDALLVLHADHEQNCSTNAVRAVGSSHVNPYSAMAAGAAALHGPRHGGANQAVLEMLEQIDSPEDVPDFLEKCKSGERRLMGFGHRVYKNYDPRARVIQDLAAEVFSAAGRDVKLDIARELERRALEDEYFIERKLYPNVDFYSGIIYSAFGFPSRVFTVFFAVGRMVGWLAHWNEMHEDEKNRIVRPRQIYVGPGRRDYVPVDERG